MDSLGNTLQSLRTMINSVHTGNYCQQNLCRTDVRRRLLTANMLLASLQRQTICWVAIGILRQANQTTGQITLIGFSRCHVARMGATKAKRNTKALGSTNSNIGAQ